MPEAGALLSSRVAGNNFLVQVRIFLHPHKFRLRWEIRVASALSLGPPSTMPGNLISLGIFYERIFGTVIAAMAADAAHGELYLRPPPPWECVSLPCNSCISYLPDSFGCFRMYCDADCYIITPFVGQKIRPEFPLVELNDYTLFP